MKVTVTKPVEINITHVLIEVPVRYEEEDIPGDFPLRVGDMWTALVDADTGSIEAWPKGKSGHLRMKVCDCGNYVLFSEGSIVARIDGDYVPHSIIPGEYGDYIDLEIDESGTITNWPKDSDFDGFDFRAE